MTKIILYTKENCSYCVKAKQLLTAKKLDYQEIRIDLNPDKRIEMERLSGRRTVPQIFINDQSIGGYDDLFVLSQSGQLTHLLN
ncbi:MAG: grxC [Gammaproteobacteria bacterium]|jgi:glutaredoxin 3|nr:grxC [Gammaproteobacteria bacterium]